MRSTTPLKVLALSGSLRTGSYNTALVRAAQEVAPEGVDITLDDISEIPLYNGDVQAKGIPEPVTALGRRIGDADAVLVATPEYNYSVPGVLKNAIDWVSRLDPQPFAGKPVGIMGASMSGMGSARAQYHLRQVFVYVSAPVMTRPEVFVGLAQKKFDEEGRLTDQDSRDFLAEYLKAFRAWARDAQALAA